MKKQIVTTMFNNYKQIRTDELNVKWIKKHVLKKNCCSIGDLCRLVLTIKNNLNMNSANSPFLITSIENFRPFNAFLDVNGSVSENSLSTSMYYDYTKSSLFATLVFISHPLLIFKRVINHVIYAHPYCPRHSCNNVMPRYILSARAIEEI